MDTDLTTLQPFEVASIRPPTENQSLALRLTRNCYWNKCAFCPAYKLTARRRSRFSKRTLEAVKADIDRAARLNRLLDEPRAAVGGKSAPSFQSLYKRAAALLHRIEAEAADEAAPEREPLVDPEAAADPVLSWFLQWINEAPSLADNLNHLLGFRLAGQKTCFLGDADNLVLNPEFLAAAIAEVKNHFPEIERFTIYGRTATAARVRRPDELEAYRRAGLDRVHFGLESGCDAVLKFMQKGETRKDHVDGCLKTKAAGLGCSVYVMPGLGGKAWSEPHASETAAILSEIQPDYIRLRSLEIFPRTPLARARDAGAFTELDEAAAAREIKTLVREIDADTMLLSDSASNLLDINGRLPDERGRMLAEIDRYLNLSPRDKLIFSLKGRIRAFEGQYGGLSEELYQALQPYMKGGALDVSAISDEAANILIRRIRARLMP